LIVEICSTNLQRLLELNKGRSVTDDPIALRVLVDAGGCSGFQYKFTVEPCKATANDMYAMHMVCSSVVHLFFSTNLHSCLSVFERNGARILVDDLSFMHVKGATLDFVRELIRAAFVVAINPNAAEACGCKMSFSVKVMKD
jgi:Fe-S cluster assembly iron-binding protein IscA